MPHKNYYSAICAIIKDEDLNIPHWVNYHFAIGFDKIYIFDNNSKTSIKKQLADYIRHGIVEVQNITLKEFPQLSAYASFLKHFGKEAHWVAFIDADEYINIKSTTDISKFLENYEEHPAIGISWKMFGSNGHLKRPENSPDKAYTSCISEHQLIKSIVRPDMVEKVSSPHHFIYKRNQLCVNEHGLPITGPRSYHTSEKIQINHYYYKSQQDYEDKMVRGLATPVKSRSGYTLDQFYSQAYITGEQETSIQRFSKKTELYTKLGPKFIATEIANRINVDIKKLLENTAETIIHKGEAAAIEKLKQAIRYNEDPLLYTSLSQIYTMQKDYKSAFKATATALSLAQENPAQKELAYRQLAAVYEKAGLTNQQKHILLELENRQL